HEYEARPSNISVINRRESHSTPVSSRSTHRTVKTRARNKREEQTLRQDLTGRSISTELHNRGGLQTLRQAATRTLSDATPCQAESASQVERKAATARPRRVACRLLCRSRD